MGAGHFGASGCVRRDNSVSVVTAVVALRDGSTGKARLSGVLGSTARNRLVSVMARHVVSTLLASGVVDHVLVVTVDPLFATSAMQGLGRRVDVIRQPIGQCGLNAAIDFGRKNSSGATDRLLVVHADLPALSREDVRAVLASHAPVVLAPDRRQEGTNVLALSPASKDFSFRFGVGSLAAHQAQTSARGVKSLLVQRAGTAIDLDTVDDWAALPLRVRMRVQEQVPAMALLSSTMYQSLRPVDNVSPQGTRHDLGRIAASAPRSSPRPS